MKFTISDSINFEIPDEIWGDMSSFKPDSSSYKLATGHNLGEVFMVHFSDIFPRKRNAGVKEFREDSLKKFINKIRNGDDINPIEVINSPDDKYKYWIKNGYHRFRVAYAAGYREFPVVMGL